MNINKKTKVIKFKKLNHNHNNQPLNNFIGFYEQNDSNQKQPTQNKPNIIKPKLIREEDQMMEKYQYKVPKEHPLIKEQKRIGEIKSPLMKKDMQKSNQKYESENFFSDNQDFYVSSIKKKTQTIKLSYPKAYTINESIQEIRNQLVDSLNKNQQIIGVQQIFSAPLMRQILGMFSEEQRSINIKSYQEEKTQKMENYQNYEEKHQQLHYNQNHNAEIFNAIQLEEQEDEDDWNPQEQQHIYWNMQQQNHQNRPVNNRGNSNNQFHFNNQRNNHYQGTQIFMPSQSTFCQQMNFQSYPIDFDL